MTRRTILVIEIRLHFVSNHFRSLYFETCSDNQLIILCCVIRRAIIKGSVGNGVPFAFIAKAYFSQSFNIFKNSFLSSLDFRLSANPLQDSISFVCMFSFGKRVVLNVFTSSKSDKVKDIVWKVLYQ